MLFSQILTLTLTIAVKIGMAKQQNATMEICEKRTFSVKSIHCSWKWKNYTDQQYAGKAQEMPYPSSGNNCSYPEYSLPFMCILPGQYELYDDDTNATDDAQAILVVVCSKVACPAFRGLTKTELIILITAVLWLTFIVFPSVSHLLCKENDKSNDKGQNNEKDVQEVAERMWKWKGITNTVIVFCAMVIQSTICITNITFIVLITNEMHEEEVQTTCGAIKCKELNHAGHITGLAIVAAAASLTVIVGCYQITGHVRKKLCMNKTLGGKIDAPPAQVVQIVVGFANIAEIKELIDNIWKRSLSEPHQFKTPLQFESAAKEPIEILCSNTNDIEAQQVVDNLCRKCNERPVNGHLVPCGHSHVCYYCCLEMLKNPYTECPTCKVEVVYYQPYPVNRQNISRFD